LTIGAHREQASGSARGAGRGGRALDWLRGGSAARRWTVALAALSAASATAGLIAFFHARDTQSALAYVAWFLLATGRDDSWKPMIQAVEQLRAHPDVPVYSKLFFADHLKFQYPISSLLLPDLLQRATAASWKAVTAMLNAVGWVAVWATGIASWRLLAGSLRDVGGDAGEGAERWLLFGAALALTLLFYPLTRSYVLGQIETPMTLLAAIALLAWRDGHKGAAGLCLGLCCVVKPQWGLVLLWGALRREWSFVGAGAAVVAVLGLVAGAMYGFADYVNYLGALRFLSRHGESFAPNQSVNGLLHRLFGEGNNLHWVADAFPPFDPVVYAATVASSAALLGAALLYRWRERASAVDLALMLLSLTIASPIAWEHHYGVLLPIFALAAPLAIAARSLGRWTAPALIAAFALASERIDLTDRLAHTWANPLQSYLFFAALIVLALLYRLSASTAL
jgi:Glycosyltransferase family 87